MSFTHLHLHTEYSLLDGSSRIEELVSRIKELGMDSVAITDHGVMYGVIDFYKECKKQGIRPIIGCEIYVVNGSLYDKNRTNPYFHLVLLAENNEGYQNLIKIVSKGFTDGYYYKPRVDKEVLRRYSKGIIALSACLAGEVQRRYLREDYLASKRAAIELEEIFGKGNFFLEIQNHGYEDQQRVIENNLNLAKELGIELVATNDSHYIYREDEQAHDILLCIQTGKKLADKDRMKYEGGQFYIKSEEEMRELFPFCPEAIDNTAKIAKRCQVDIEFGKLKLPKYEIATDEQPFDYLKRLCMEGLYKKYEKVEDEHLDRLNFELDVIKNMGYIDYFLIVEDFIRFAKQKDIPVGPGRGSAAGSIVSYALDITEIDPLAYELLFERFLNPERVSMPDIDIDFCYHRRQEVIDYVVALYGTQNVVQIITFGTMAPRAVIRDVGRVLDLPYNEVDRVAKLIPSELKITIDKAIDKVAELKEMTEKDPQIAYLIKMAKRLEGIPRHSSVHAAGVVISKEEITEYVPVSRGADGVITTEFTMNTLEELGLLKMDFLGLRTLTVIQNCIKLVNKHRGISIDIKSIPIDDESVYEMISTGDTMGVFQLESLGMRSFMKELRPDSIEDIIAGLSLYRPGPMDFIPTYCKRKHGLEPVIYDTPELESILKTTYGCIVYQEQVMNIVRKLAGYTLGQSDLLRRAMSKKKSDVMIAERKDFIYGNEDRKIRGCINNGISEEVANKIYDEMLDFAKYAFNKSHAAAYALVSYQTAYLKKHYLVEYMAALMTSYIDSNLKVAEYIEYCRSVGIQLMAPDINFGQNDFSINDGKIVFALSVIKNVGRGVVEEIIIERELRGKFKDLRDFISRISNKCANKRTLESLIKSGALDCLGGNRREKLFAFAKIIEEISFERKGKISGQTSLMDFLDDKSLPSTQLEKMEEFDKGFLLKQEKEMLGVYISGHPLEEYADIIKKVSTTSTLELNLENEDEIDRKSVIIGGIIVDINIKMTKKGDQMAFLVLEDNYSTIEIICFPKVYEEYKSLMRLEGKVFVKGNIQTGYSGKANIIATKINDMNNLDLVVWIKFASKEDYDEDELIHILKQGQGRSLVKVWVEKERSLKSIDEYRILANDEMVKKLYDTYGTDNIKLENTF